MCNRRNGPPGWACPGQLGNFKACNKVGLARYLVNLVKSEIFPTLFDLGSGSGLPTCTQVAI